MRVLYFYFLIVLSYSLIIVKIVSVMVNNIKYLGQSKSSEPGVAFYETKVYENFFFYQKIERVSLYLSMVFDKSSRLPNLVRFGEEVFLSTTRW